MRIRNARRLSLALFAALFALAGEAGAQAAASARIDLRVERAALLAADSALSRAAATRGMLAGVLPHFAEDAAYLHPGRPLLRGRDSIRAYMAATPAAGEVRFDWRAIRTDVSGDGLLGYTFGYGRTSMPGATTPPAPGGYAIVWRKGGDGAWKVVAFVRNNSRADLAAAPAGFESPSYAQYPSFPNASEAEARAAVSKADSDFSDDASKLGPPGAFAAYAAPDGALLNGAFGPEAIRASQPPLQPGAVLRWRPVIAGATPSADLAYTVGTGEVTQGGAVVARTKYITVWKRQPTGGWLYVVDGGNGG